MAKADDHIGDLHAGVVNVVLHLDGLAGGAQQANRGVAEHGVPQVTDVGRLVRIDRRVLNDDLAAELGHR